MWWALNYVHLSVFDTLRFLKIYVLLELEIICFRTHYNINCRSVEELQYILKLCICIIFQYSIFKIILKNIDLYYTIILHKEIVFY